MEFPCFSILKLQPCPEHDPTAAGLPVGGSTGAGDDSEARSAAGNRSRGSTEIRVIERVIEVKGEVERLFFLKYDPFPKRTVKVPEPQTVHRVPVSIDTRTKLDKAEIVKHRLRVSEKIEPRAPSGWVAIGSDTARACNIPM